MTKFPNTFLMSYLKEHLDTELCLKCKLPLIVDSMISELDR